MAKFIQVTESRYKNKLWLNLESVSYVHPDSGTVMINAVHGEGNGIMRFDGENIDKIVAAITQLEQLNQPCAAHGVTGCTMH